MENIFRQGMLYDFYGELLTEHQRSIYEDAVYNDMSLGEIAKERGISRQGVHDLIRRCDRILQDYEDKLHLVERFVRAGQKIARIEALAGGGKEAVAKGLRDEAVREVSCNVRSADDAEQELAGLRQDLADLTARMAKIRELAGSLTQEL